LQWLIDATEVILLLNDWMTEQKMVDGILADKLGFSREYIRLIRSGKRLPSEATVNLIEHISDGAVTMEDIQFAYFTYKDK
jgi:hypothetical protein